MKHLYRISLTWAVVVLLLSIPKHLLQNKELDYKINQHKVIILQLENKKAELELLNRLQNNMKIEPSSSSKKNKENYLKSTEMDKTI